MSDETTNSTQRFNKVLERFSKLNTGGRHYFIGRLTSSAIDKPALRLELERVLQRLETDSNLRRCWSAGGPFEAEATLTAEAAA